MSKSAIILYYNNLYGGEVVTMLSKRGRCLQVKKVVTVKPYLSLPYTCTYMYMKILASMEIDRDFFSSSLLLRANVFFN